MKADLYRISRIASRAPTLAKIAKGAQNPNYRANQWIEEPRYGGLRIYVRITRRYFPQYGLIPTIELANIGTLPKTGGYLYKFIKEQILENKELDGRSIFLENVEGPKLIQWIEKQFEGKYKDPLEFQRISSDPDFSPSFLLYRPPLKEETPLK